MNEPIRSVLDQIYSDVRSRDMPSASLFDGEAGCILFECLYLRHFGDARGWEAFGAAVRRLTENALDVGVPTFCPGKSGINWVFSYLYKRGLLDEGDWALLCEDDPLLAEAALAFQERGRYDFFYGSLGIAYQLLYSRGDTYAGFFTALWERLNSCVVEGAFIYAYDLEAGQLLKDQVNLGLSHGITSILKFCIRCYQLDICAEEARTLAQGIVRFLLSHSRRDTADSFFPNLIHRGSDGDEPSRLAWCYGDLGISYILYQAGLVFGDQRVRAQAEHVLLHCTTRTDPKDTLVEDAGLCHGSAGVAHIYNRVWHYTGHPAFKEACDFWIGKTIGFKRGTDHGLLEGSPGVGLALITYLTGDFGWDYCMMLNE